MNVSSASFVNPPKTTDNNPDFDVEMLNSFLFYFYEKKP